jgi:hypothetical protein
MVGIADEGHASHDLVEYRGDDAAMRDSGISLVLRPDDVFAADVADAIVIE